MSVMFLLIVLTSKAQPADVIMWYDCDHGALINSRPDHGWNNLNPSYPNDPAEGGLLTNNYYYLKCASDGAVLAMSRPPKTDVFAVESWNTTQYQGTEVPV